MQDSRDDKLELKALTASITVLLMTVLVFGGCMYDDGGSNGAARAETESALDSDADVSNEVTVTRHALNATDSDSLDV